MSTRVPTQRAVKPTRPTLPRAPDRVPAVLLGLGVALAWFGFMLALAGAGRTVVVVVGLLALNVSAAWFLAHHVEPDEDEPVIPGPCTRRPHR